MAQKEQKVQTLLLGLGGTGSRVVNNVVKELRLHNKSINNGEMCCAVLDTNQTDNDLIRNSQTSVPVFGTGKAQMIDRYMIEYEHLHMDEWCPWSPTFGRETIIDGASEMRVKSRIAFMDFVESGEAGRLEALIYDMLKNNEGSKIRVMIVSSLSGGSGSGMFIQVALWLRRLLEQSAVSITGTFLLPDVFVSTLGDIKGNKTKINRHYTNAYAAIRDLNTLSQISLNDSLDITERIVLGDLFDSDRDRGCGKAVYDWAFFVDDKDQNGNPLRSIQEYEQMVAQLVYMQLYAPLAENELYSVLDNAFLERESADEPLYGACGTAKAVYPVDSVKTYCALRATQDSLTTGWTKIDDEIDALIAEQKKKEEDGMIVDEINPRSQYILLYEEKTSVTRENAGGDLFFYNISKDAKNKERKVVDGKVYTSYPDKVEQFITALENGILWPFISKQGDVGRYSLNVTDFVAKKHTKQALQKKYQEDKKNIDKVIKMFETQAKLQADGIVNSIFPLSMGDVQAHNPCSIYGLLTKPGDQEGERVFIHPVAARYVLYRLIADMKKILDGFVLEQTRKQLDGLGDRLFDNPATAALEIDIDDLDASRKFYQSKGAFWDEYEKRYAEYINTKVHYCKKYQLQLMQNLIYNKLIERVNGLIDQLEAFFKRLDDVSDKLKKDLAANIAETQDTDGKTVFVMGKQADKERIYKKLNMGLGGSNDSDKAKRSQAVINRSVINSTYGRYCAQKRPRVEENAEYRKMNAVVAFLKAMIASYRDKIDDDTDNSEYVNMNFYQALREQFDSEFGVQKDTAETGEDLDSLDVSTGEVKPDDGSEKLFENYFMDFKNKMYRMAAPFLIHEQERSKNDFGGVTMSNRTFWGFHPDVAKAYPNISAILMNNADLANNDAYAINEFCCFRALCCLKASLIPKFKESTRGVYFTSYEQTIKEMLERADEIKHPDYALVTTPHLDKHWHRILPHITPEKRKEEEIAFCRGFWLAIAYGTIRVDKDGHFVLQRQNDDTAFPITRNGMELGKMDIALLLEELKADKLFTGSEIAELEKEFQREQVKTYVGTKVVKGLTVTKDEINPVQIIVRYNEGSNKNRRTAVQLIEALETIAFDLATKHDGNREDLQMKKAAYSICRRIYDSSKRSQGKSKAFARWERIFELYNLKENVDLE